MAAQPAAPIATITVTVGVDCTAAITAGYTVNGGSGTVLADTAVTLPAGSSVYDALAACGIFFAGSGGYVSAIGGLAERDCGGASGWMYQVNGAFAGTGAGSYELSGGELVRWIYTTNGGSDIGAAF